MYMLPCPWPSQRFSFSFIFIKKIQKMIFWKQIQCIYLQEWPANTISCFSWSMAVQREKRLMMWSLGAIFDFLRRLSAPLQLLGILSKHENVTLQWVGALPSLKHIWSLFLPLSLYCPTSSSSLLSFCLCSVNWINKELRWGCVQQLLLKKHTHTHICCTRGIRITRRRKGKEEARGVHSNRTVPGCNLVPS